MLFRAHETPLPCGVYLVVDVDSFTMSEGLKQGLVYLKSSVTCRSFLFSLEENAFKGRRIRLQSGTICIRTQLREANG
jgi:hypothetical protein